MADSRYYYNLQVDYNNTATQAMADVTMTPPSLNGSANIQLNKSFDQDTLKSWSVFGDKMFLRESSVALEPGKVYNMGFDEQQGDACLIPSSVTLEIPSKVYGLQDNFIEDCISMYGKLGPKRSLGVLLYGVQGTGKTITGKILSTLLEQPIILMGGGLYNNYGTTTVTSAVAKLLSNIPQPVTVFFDEFEKHYGDGDKMLSLMDGTLSSPYKRMFIMTTNSLDINVNFKQRPSRVRYVKKFDSLTQENIEEIVSDALEDKAKKDDLMGLFARMDLVTVDLVTSIIEEVNWTTKSVLEIASTFNLELKEEQKKFFNKKKDTILEEIKKQQDAEKDKKKEEDDMEV